MTATMAARACWTSCACRRCPSASTTGSLWRRPSSGGAWGGRRLGPAQLGACGCRCGGAAEPQLPRACVFAQACGLHGRACQLSVRAAHVLARSQGADGGVHEADTGKGCCRDHGAPDGQGRGEEGGVCAAASLAMSSCFGCVLRLSTHHTGPLIHTVAAIHACASACVPHEQCSSAQCHALISSAARHNAMHCEEQLEPLPTLCCCCCDAWQVVERVRLKAATFGQDISTVPDGRSGSATGALLPRCLEVQRQERQEQRP